MRNKSIASFVLALLIAVPMFGQSLSVNYKARAIESVLSDLESKTNYKFVYQKQELAGAPAVTLKLQNAPFTDILGSICAEAGLTYEIVKESVVLRKGQIQHSASRNVTVSGTVTDQSGAPIVGASVFEQGTLNGVSTDANGKYSISVKSGATLIYSCIGYSETNRRAAAGPVNVTLADDYTLLEETVVVGYGVQKKSDLTGSITSVKSDALQNRSVNDITAAMSGKVAGMQVISTTGMPGEIGQIRLRGLSSNTSEATAPLYIVDGILVSDLNDVDPQNVESIEILKDGASASIYGAQAGNGVVLVTTKRGTKGRGKVSYDGSYTFEKLGYAPKMMNAKQYIDVMTSSTAIAQANIDTYYDGKTDTDWMKEMYPGGYAQKHKVSFEGGNDKSTFYTAISYLTNDGILASDMDKYTRLGVQVNASHKIKDWLTVGTNNSFTKASSAFIWNMGGLTAGGSSENGGFYTLVGMDPLTPAFYTDPSQMWGSMKSFYENGDTMLKYGDKWLSYSAFQKTNHPLVNVLSLERGAISHNALAGNIYANFTPVKGLVYTSKLGYKFRTNNDVHLGKVYCYGEKQNDDPAYQGIIKSYLNYQWDNFVNYSVSIAKNHNIDAMAGMSYVRESSDYLQTTCSGFMDNTNPLFFYPSFFDADANKTVKGAPEYFASLSYFARLGYNYANRYYIQGSIRADAFDESYLPKENRWGYFPSVSFGWNITNEPFMDGVSKDAVSLLKVRGSWGTNGNVSILRGQYAYTGNVYLGDYLSVMDGYDHSFSMGAGPDGLNNPGLRWETSKQYDLGIDANFLSDRLTTTLDLYNKVTDGLLVESPMPITTGWGSTVINGGTVVNKGVEFEASWRDKIGDFHYQISANIAHNANKVTHMECDYITGTNPLAGSYPNRMSEGEPLWYFYGYKYLGVDTETGAPKFEDISKDEKYSADDYQKIGDPNPDFTYGITLSAEWKGIDLTVFGTGSHGNDIWFGTMSSSKTTRNFPEYIYKNLWTKAGDNTRFPSYFEFSKGYITNSSAMVMDGSYFRINQIQLGYSLPSALLSKIKVSTLRLYVSLDNYFMFTKYCGYDPATTSCDFGAGNGVDRGTYPTPKSLMCGVNISF